MKQTDARDFGTPERIMQKHKGAYSEHLAIAWLLSLGYEVYRNVSAHGAVDLIAICGQDIRRIDVKTVHPNVVQKTGTVSCSIPLARDTSAELLFVCPDGFITFKESEAFERVTGRQWIHKVHGRSRRPRIRNDEGKFFGGAAL